MNILVSLHKGYGLGDAVQMSSVLRHVVKARPRWKIDYQAEDGKHQVGRGIVVNTFAYGDPYPTPSYAPSYDAEVQILLFDNWYGWIDRPNTIVSSCLHERFGLEWREDCSRYQVAVSDDIKRWAADTVPANSVAIHYQGVTAKDKKDLTDEQALAICDHVSHLGLMPKMMGKVPLGYSAEVNCAIIDRCLAFVGIDSGPSKCAAATDTPSLVVWTGHHPAKFYDPAPNVTHLVPEGFHSMLPARDAEKVARWFDENYSVRTYSGDPVAEINRWLTETLKWKT